MIYAGVSFASVLFLPETLASKILRRKASRLNKKNKETGKRFVAPSDLEQKSVVAALVRSPLKSPAVFFMGCHATS